VSKRTRSAAAATAAIGATNPLRQRVSNPACEDETRGDQCQDHQIHGAM
jgi:hypothetical protein